MTSPHSIAVVGASLAGLRTVEALRREGYSGHLTLVGDEPRSPYDRPPLSKQFLEGKWDEDKLALRKQGFADLDVDLRLGSAAVGLDARQRVLTLADGTRLPFDRLALTMGARPRPLPGASPRSGAFMLRSLQDAAALRERLLPGTRVAIVGAGFIGLEVAAACRSLGLETTAIELEPLPLARRLGPELATQLYALHQERGVRFRCGVGVRSLEGSARIDALELTDGTRVSADVVVVGLGVAPNTEFLRGSAVALDERDASVRCDSRCGTSVEGIAAAGDVASFYHERYERRVRIEHWTNAVEMAAAAARRLLAPSDAVERIEPYAPVPYFWSDHYGLKLQFCGEYAAGDRWTLVDGSIQAGRLLALFSRAGKLTAAVGVSRPVQLMRLRALLADPQTTLERGLEAATA